MVEHLRPALVVFHDARRFEHRQMPGDGGHFHPDHGRSFTDAAFLARQFLSDEKARRVGDGLMNPGLGVIPGFVMGGHAIHL